MVLGNAQPEATEEGKGPGEDEYEPTLATESVVDKDSCCNICEVCCKKCRLVFLVEHMGNQSKNGDWVRTTSSRLFPNGSIELIENLSLSLQPSHY